jgi:hypothetical protein
MSYHQIGNRHFSYDTCIRELLPDGRSIGNVTKYSATTSKHQRQACVQSCDVKIDNVPTGTSDLTELYLQRNPAEAPKNYAEEALDDVKKLLILLDTALSCMPAGSDRKRLDEQYVAIDRKYRPEAYKGR